MSKRRGRGREYSARWPQRPQGLEIMTWPQSRSRRLSWPSPPGTATTGFLYPKVNGSQGFYILKNMFLLFKIISLDLWKELWNVYAGVMGDCQLKSGDRGRTHQHLTSSRLLFQSCSFNTKTLLIPKVHKLPTIIITHILHVLCY